MSHHICFKQNVSIVIMLEAEWIDTYNVHHERIFRNRYRKLVRVGFDATTTEFRSAPVTDLVIGHWLQLAPKTNLVEILQFHLLVHCSRVIFFFELISGHICFNRSLAQVITLVVEWIETFGIHHWMVFRERYGKFPWVRFEPTTTEFCSDRLTEWAIRPLNSTRS